MDTQAEAAIRFCQTHGLIVAIPDDHGDGGESDRFVTDTRHAPVVLKPSALPSRLLNRGVELCLPFNSLVDRIARASEFLQRVLRPVAETDDFVARLLEVHSHVADAEYERSWMLGLHRSDYMVQGMDQLKQIEINTIASSFGCLGTLTSRMHTAMAGRFGWDGGVPLDNRAMDGLIEALADAAAHYNSLHRVPESCILFVVQRREGNLFDQLHLSDALTDKHGVPVVRRTLTELGAADVSDGVLRVSGHEVSVVYFRAGYTPDDYPSDAEWRTRLAVEQCRAIKCPSVAYQLVGAKKIQQELSVPGVLDQFLPASDVALVSSCFAGLHQVSDESVEMALANPHAFVLKPQREGGGNNIYEDELVRMLQTMSIEERRAYILMERIFAPVRQDCVFIRRGAVTSADAVSELGIFGVFYGNGDSVLFNNYAGYLVRTKVTGLTA